MIMTGPCFVFLLFFPITFCFENEISRYLNMEYELDTLHRKSNFVENINVTLSKVETHYFDQLLDHFNYDTTTWKQQYFTVFPKNSNEDTLNEESTRIPDLAFICIGGEWDVSAYDYCYENIQELFADHENAVGFSVEHRFYGDSQPTGDLSVKSFAYHNSKQALADLAYFVKKIVFDKHKIVRPPILIGCSYAGTLSTWFRKKYPHLSMGAVALSPPLKAKVDFTQYNEVGYAAGYALDEKCMEMLPEARKQLYNVAENDKDSFEEKLGLCKTKLRNQNETYPQIANSVWLSVTGYFIVYAQTGYKENVTCFCKILKEKGVFAAARDVIQKFGPRGSAELCVDPFYIQYNEWVASKEKHEKQLGLRTDVMWRSWYWQKCSEFGWFKTNSTTKNVFTSFSLKDFSDVCRAIFLINRKELENNIEQTNIEFGAYDESDLTRLLVINGQYDPWKAVSLPEQQGSYEDVVSLVIPKGHHCPTEIPETYKRIKEAIKVWMKVSEIALLENKL